MNKDVLCDVGPIMLQGKNKIAGFDFSDSCELEIRILIRKFRRLSIDRLSYCPFLLLPHTNLRSRSENCRLLS
jgi:hypothetical protein